MEAQHRRAGRQAQRQRFFRRDRAFALAQPFAVRRAAAGTHVFRERRQLREVLFHARRHEVARALAPHQQSFFHQPFDRLAHRDARHRQFLGQLALRRQGVVDAQYALLDGFAQGALQLLVERQLAVRIERAQQVGQGGHFGNVSSTTEIPMTQTLPLQLPNW